MIEKLKQISGIRKKLKNGGISIGTWQQIPNSSISEILGESGYDWVAVDLEHGSISVDQLPDLFRAIELGQTIPLARISEASSKDAKQALDAGAYGIILPMINNSKQLKEIIHNACWPPAGSRGVGFSRANMFGSEFDNYIKFAQNPLIIAQVEHIDAVDNLEEIVQIDGLDGIIIGPYDLSASMGLTGNFHSSDFISIIEKIISICNKYNIPCGDHIVDPNPELLNERINQGFRLLAYSTDGVFLNANCKNPKIN